MNRIPRFFGHSKRSSDMDSKHKPKGPKLERRLAKKYIDYELSTSSSSSSSGRDSSSLRTRSLELPPLESRRSFRVQGIDGEFDEICRSLGLSGPDDFAIPADWWESRNRKARSSSDLLPRPPLHQPGSPKVDSDSVRVAVRARGLPEPAESIERTDVCDLSNKLRDNLGVNDRDENKNVLCDSDRLTRNIESSRNGGGIKGVRPPVLAPPPSRNIESSWNSGGIKGVRPPVLAPPPSISLPVLDDSCSTWDILRSFAPDFDEGSSSARGYVSSDDEENEEIEQREGVNEVRPGETAVLSTSCSFTTSNDDDSSSTTTEPMSSISPNGRFRRIISGWQKGELLGRGSFGSVYEGIADGGFFFAVKVVSLLDQGDLGRQSIYQLEQEIALLSQFEHENIVQYFGTDKDESNLYIFLELVTKGSLLSLYRQYDLRDSQVSSYTRQILHGLKYLHERDVIHRDIKCANILVDASGSVKLADFGLAKATKLNDVKSCKGTAFWMAPEVVNGKNSGYGFPADIWSLGCTVLEMLTHQIPYSDFECMQALFRIGRGHPPPVPDSLSRDARHFILKCLQVDPAARPTAAELLNHPFVRRSLPPSSGSSSPYHPTRRI